MRDSTTVQWWVWVLAANDQLGKDERPFLVIEHYLEAHNCCLPCLTKLANPATPTVTCVKPDRHVKCVACADSHKSGCPKVSLYAFRSSSYWRAGLQIISLAKRASFCCWRVLETMYLRRMLQWFAPALSEKPLALIPCWPAGSMRPVEHPRRGNQRMKTINFLRACNSGVQTWLQVKTLGQFETRKAKFRVLRAVESPW